ncbi:hypothetical protein FHR34_001251 [Kitasatospora kifunensis]|uniref:Uncharacterized protein n=1 Tax=Kitasatospora kifunensis TaxID=58351 RepID=A0A7W7VTY3_KITKI|nr:hypothetical protein [Kitasatospora kifunensis]
MITLDFCPATPCPGHDCPDYQAQRRRERTLGLALHVDSGLTAEEAQVERLLRRALQSSHPTTSTGVAHHMPDAPFQVHTVAAGDGSTIYAAVYCGDQPVDELLAKSPVYVAP